MARRGNNQLKMDVFLWLTRNQNGNGVLKYKCAYLFIKGEISRQIAQYRNIRDHVAVFKEEKKGKMSRRLQLIVEKKLVRSIFNN